MDSTALLIGLVAALAAQATKAEGWNAWVKKFYAIGLSLGAFAMDRHGLSPDVFQTVLAALATHSFLLADTAGGSALKWNLLGRFADVVKAVFPNGGDKP